MCAKVISAGCRSPTSHLRQRRGDVAVGLGPVPLASRRLVVDAICAPAFVERCIGEGGEVEPLLAPSRRGIEDRLDRPSPGPGLKLGILTALRQGLDPLLSLLPSDRDLPLLPPLPAKPPPVPHRGLISRASPRTCLRWGNLRPEASFPGRAGDDDPAHPLRAHAEPETRRYGVVQDHRNLRPHDVGRAPFRSGGR